MTRPEILTLTAQFLKESEAKIDKAGRLRDPSEFPWRRDRHGREIERPIDPYQKIRKENI